jgi:hypothetical protein
MVFAINGDAKKSKTESNVAQINATFVIFMYITFMESCLFCERNSAINLNIVVPKPRVPIVEKIPKTVIDKA